MQRALLTLALLSPVMALQGCLATGLSEVEAEEGFDWDTLKRDQIVMTPLLDLRRLPPSDAKGDLAFFDDAKRYDYPEAFKQVFFKLRKDIRVFGAGGAYEYLAKLPNLGEVADHVMSKTPLSDEQAAAIRAGSQDIRFVFFFAMVEESLARDFTYTFRRDKEADLKEYSSIRTMVVRLALWDSKTNRTVWRGTERLKPRETLTLEVRNPSKRKKKVGDAIVWEGSPERTSLQDELTKNPARFPAYPGREPSFSASFDDFALALPLHPSEAKLIEYTHFTYHRPELAVRTAAIGTKVAPSLQLGTSSVINYHLRFGAAVDFLLGTVAVGFEGKDYEVTSSAIGATFDYEWELTPRLRLLAGAMAGAAVFSAQEVLAETVLAPEPEPEPEPEPLTDGALFLWPRVYLLFGAKDGLQLGLGGSLRQYDGIEDSLFKAHRPSLWSVDLGLAYAFRGF